MTSDNPESISMGKHKTEMPPVSQQGAGCEDPTPDASFGKEPEDGGGGDCPASHSMTSRPGSLPACYIGSHGQYRHCSQLRDHQLTNWQKLKWGTA